MISDKTPIDADPGSNLRQVAPRVFGTDHFSRRFLDLSVAAERAQRRDMNVRCGSEADVPRSNQIGPLLEAERTFSVEKRTCPSPMSAIGGKADVRGTAPKSPLMAISGHSSIPFKTTFNRVQ